MSLTDKTKNNILELQKKYPVKRSALIPALHMAQSEKGYLPREIQNEVAFLFDIDPNEVNAVVTFYDMFFEEPVGKHVIHACKNISCMLRGADEMIDSLCKKVNVPPGRHVSPDGEFTVLPSECLGACNLAPMLIIDDEVVGPVEMHNLDDIIKRTKERAPRHG